MIAVELVRKQKSRGRERFLLLTDPDLKTGAARAVIADLSAQSVERVRNAAVLLRSPEWQPLAKNDPSLDDLVRRVPALRRHRGIEIRLASGAAAWILWRQWSSADPTVQARLTALTGEVSVPAYEPDGDFFLAAYAAKLLGAEVVDPPRTTLNLGSEAY